MHPHFKRVLVTDDEAITQLLLRKLLESLGYEVTIANHGEEAIEYFKADPFPWVIMDFNMPKMNGITAVMHIRALEKKEKAYIVGLTACDDHLKIKEGLKAGMDEVYIKPITPDLIAGLFKKKILIQKGMELLP